MNALQFFGVSWAVIAAWLAANLIPYISAWLTAHPGWWTGIITMAISFVDGLLAIVATSSGPLNWRHILVAAFGAWAVAGWHQRNVLSGTVFEARLHAKGLQIHDPGTAPKSAT